MLALILLKMKHRLLGHGHFHDSRAAAGNDQQFCAKRAGRRLDALLSPTWSKTDAVNFSATSTRRAPPTRKMRYQPGWRGRMLFCQARDGVGSAVSDTSLR